MRGRGLVEGWRRRELAGDERAGSFARRQARSTHLRYIRRHWPLLLLLGATMGIGGGAALFLIPTGVVRAYAAGVLTAATIATLMFTVTLMSGTAGSLMGDLAEQWSASELRKLRRRGWRVVNHVMLRTWDIDHVLVGPGGVYAVETKWSSHPWELDPPEPRVIAAAQRAAQNARHLTFWQPLKAATAGQAAAVVILWGGTEDPVDRVVEAPSIEAVVLPARAVQRWRDALPQDRLTPEQVEVCWRALDRQVRVRDPREGAPPPSWTTMLVRAFTVFAAAVLAFLGIANVLPLVDSYSWWAVTFIAALVVGFVARRIQPIRLYANGWLAGVLATVVLGAVLIVHKAGQG